LGYFFKEAKFRPVWSHCSWIKRSSYTAAHHSSIFIKFLNFQYSKICRRRFSLGNLTPFKLEASLSKTLSYFFLFYQIFRPILSYQFYPTNFVLPILFYQFCSEDFVLKILSYRFCPTDFVLQILFYRFCPTDFVLQILSYRFCPTDFVLQTLSCSFLLPDGTRYHKPITNSTSKDGDWPGRK
jgi:hypothetical protein